MIYLLSHYFNIGSTAVGTLFFAEFLLLVLYTHWMISRHNARKAQNHPELYLVADNG